MNIPQRKSLLYNKFLIKYFINISGQTLKLYCIIQEFTSHVIVQNKIILLVKSAFKPVAHQAGAYPGF